MNRHRERADTKTLEDHVRYNDGVEVDRVTCVLHSKGETMDDVLTPNFHQRILNGEIINNPVSYVSESFDSGGGSYLAVPAIPPLGVGTPTVTGSGGSTTYYSRVRNLLPTFKYVPPVPSLGDATSLAKQKAIANIDSVPHDMLEDAFEIRETIKFLKSPLRSLSELAKKMSKSKGSLAKKSADRAKALADAWLAGQFAAAPLARSILTLADGLNTPCSRPKRRTARGFSKSSTSSLETEQSPTNPNNLYNVGSITEVNVRAGIIYEVSNPICDIRFKYGFRSKDVPSVLWEIIPLSFMVDRLLNLQLFFQGLTNLLDPNVKILAGWVVHKVFQTSEITWISAGQTNYTITVAGDPLHAQKFEYVRVPWRPKWSDTLPTLQLRGLVSDSVKILDLIALTLGRLGRR